MASGKSVMWRGGVERKIPNSTESLLKRSVSKERSELSLSEAEGSRGSRILKIRAS
jgi:hypothetical protein